MSIGSSGQITITDLSDGNDGVGIQNTDITYANSTSGTTAPSTGWTSSVPTLVKGQYLWTKTVWTYTDTSSKTGYSVSYNSKDGTNGTDGTSGIIVSSVAPDSPQNGQLWQDTSTTPQLVKKWTGSSWVIWELYVENMNVNNLSALSPNLGNITGGSYESWSSDINQESGNVNFNGVYIKNGKTRSLTIIYPENITPDKNTFQGGLYTGTQIGNDGVSYFAINSNQMDNITPHELLTESDNVYGFWERRALNNVSSYAGKLFTSYIDGTSYGLAFDSPNGLSVIGDLYVSGDVTDNSDWQWLNSNHYARYKKSFGYVSIYYDCSRTSVGNIFLGDLPADCRPTLGNIMTTANAFSTSSTNNRNLQINGPGGGAVNILNAVANQKYTGMYTFKL